MRLGILGGTFNPIHLGHLLLAETAREALKLDRVLFVPTAQPPHKRSRDLAPGAARMALIHAAIRGNPGFAASEIELQRGGVSYSVDTVKILHEQLPMAKLFLVVGEDMLGVRWAAWDTIQELCTVVAAHRPGITTRRVRGVTWLPMPQVEIASSDIRARCKLGKSIRYLVPPGVEQVITRLGLYGRTSGKETGA